MANGKTAAVYYADRTEQNDPHIALGKHNFIAPYVSGRIAEELGPMTNRLSPPWPRRKANLSSGCKKTPRRCAKAALISTAQFGITQQPRIEILMCAASGAGK